MNAGWWQAIAWPLGAALGLTLFQCSFSFAGSFRLLLGARLSAMFRAQLVLLALTTLLILPVVAGNSLFGLPMRGLVFPTGVATLIGAFLFGIGMQLGGGCGSGTLYAAGAGSMRMWLTLACFVIGATLAAWHAELWNGLPALPPVALAAEFGLWPTLLGTFIIIGGLYALVQALERARHGQVATLRWRPEQGEDKQTGGMGGASRLWGPWPLLWGAAGLALLNLATLVLMGRPWAITAAFPLWGAKAVEALNWDDPAFWAYWEDPTRTEALLRPLGGDRITAMDLGLMLGALFAASLTDRAARMAWPCPGHVLASLVGGLLLGVGAVIASGCNISAWISGTASGSLHGWVWIVPALAGNLLGMKLRPVFGMNRPVSSRQ